jgi:two-component system, LuxR family, response regulator FixJ
MTEQDALIFVVDDDAAMRRSLEYLFDSAGWHVALFESAHDFLDRYDGHLPGCLVLDVRMPLMSGLELQQVLKERGILLPIVFLSSHGDVPIAVQALKNGACDFLEKPCKDQALLDTVARAVKRCIELCRRDAQNQMLQGVLATLTPREREVVELVALGKPNKLIARELAISEKTVQVHRYHAMEKLGVHSAAEITRMLTAGSDTAK